MTNTNINRIDTFIDDELNYLFEAIYKSPTMTKVFKEPNFIKFQREINEFMESHTKNIDIKQLKEFVKTNDAVYEIVETIKRYAAIYIFLTIGYNYKSNENMYMSNVIEFTQHQKNYNYRIKNFFNSDNNSIIIKYNQMVHNIVTILNADKPKLEILKKKPEFIEVIKILNELGADYVKTNFYNENKQIVGHNIIKTLVVRLLYKVNEKKDFFRLLEMVENLEGDVIFINIVVPKHDYLDYNTIEQLTDVVQSDKFLAKYLWEFIENSEIVSSEITKDQKITRLFDTQIVYPIVDDFLLFHRDSEKYEGKMKNRDKKKSVTKINYIVNKIDLASELYSDKVVNNPKLHSEVIKKFHPLTYRKAISVNYRENLEILQGYARREMLSAENLELFRDLKAYNSYPYVNFKAFENGGFGIDVEKTYDAMRYVSIADKGPFQQKKHNIAQFRVVSKGMIGNVVGIAIPSSLRSIKCLRRMDFININEISDKLISNNQVLTKYSPEFRKVFEYLKTILFKVKKHESSIVWTFDKKDNENFEDHAKDEVAALYDNLVKELIQYILDEIDKREDWDLPTLERFIKRKQRIFPQENIFSIIETDVYNKIPRIVPTYDASEDNVYGLLNEDTMKKEEPKPPNKVPSFVIDVSGLTRAIIQEEKEYVDGVCQHNVSWDMLIQKQRRNPQQYIEDLNAFVQQYVMENVDGNYICKSCGFQINLRKYVIEGTFDDDLQRFIPFSSPLLMPLEDIREYSKYAKAIRDLNKIMNAIADRTGLSFISSSNVMSVTLKRNIIKNTIDLIIANNNRLKKINLKRRERVGKLYGVGNETRLYTFDFDNSILEYSEQSKDIFQYIKYNNVMVYLVLNIMLELNESHLINIQSQKKDCGFKAFEKLFNTLFNNLKLRYNSKGDTSYITKYKNLCFVMYVFGCSMAYSRLWKLKDEATMKMKVAWSIMIKEFIHTFVDIFNSIMETTDQDNNSLLFTTVTVKMIKRLETIFSDAGVYSIIKGHNRKREIEQRRIGADMEGVSFEMTLDPKDYFVHFGIPYRVPRPPTRYYPPTKPVIFEKYTKISSLSNCPSGEFHKFFVNKTDKGAYYECSNCGFIVKNGSKQDVKNNTDIVKNYVYLILKEIAQTKCPVDGVSHKFERGVCTKCNHGIDDNYTQIELDKLNKNLTKIKNESYQNIVKLETDKQANIKGNLEYNRKVYASIEKKYNKDTNLDFVDRFTKLVFNVVGKDIGVSNQLVDNTYIIDHDHQGLTLNKPIVITDASKISYKQNHPFFKTNVIYFTNYKPTKVDIFYDSTTNILLGYKEDNRDFVTVNNADRKIKIEYSILNKLKLMGYQSNFIDLTLKFRERITRHHTTPQYADQILNELINALVSERITNLKKVIYNFQTVYTQILTQTKKLINENDYFTTELNKLVNSYIRKLDQIGYNEKIFKHWKGVYRGIHMENIDHQKVIRNFENPMKDKLIINTYYLTKNDHHGNMILYYLVSEFENLINSIEDNYTKATIVRFIMEFVNIMFDEFNLERYRYIPDVKVFEYLLHIGKVDRDILDKFSIEGSQETYKAMDEENMTEEEKAARDEELLDMKEANDAYQMEVDEIDDAYDVEDIGYPGEADYDRGNESPLLEKPNNEED